MSPAIQPSSKMPKPDRLAGLFYFAIIILGLGAEILVRGALIDPNNPAKTVTRILSSTPLFQIGILADSAMIACDIAVAVLLYSLFAKATPSLALSAMLFRLLQAATISASLLFQISALQAVTYFGLQGAIPSGPLLTQFNLNLQTHALGYDLGLIFFGINCLLTALILTKTNSAPKPLSMAIALAGVVYITGSALRFLSEDLHTLFMPAYLITILAETAFAIWLLTGKISKNLSCDPHHG